MGIEKNLKINGKIYETFTNEEGATFFKPNNLFRKLQIQFDIKVSDVIKLCELDAISKMDLLDYYANIGMQVSFVEELSLFEDFEFEWV